MLLHAGDKYSPNYISEAVALADANPGAVIYGGYSHGDKTIPHGEVGSGFLFHHMGINHLTFLVPANVYKQIGLYEIDRKIVSDHVWTRRVILAGIKFVRHPNCILEFAPGGASTGSTKEQRSLVVTENIVAFKRFFPFLPDDIAEAIYLYRFEEKRLWRIRDYIIGLRKHVASNPSIDLALSALSDAFQYIWNQRPLNVKLGNEVCDQAEVRVSICGLLSIPIGSANICSGGLFLKSLEKQITELKTRFKSQKIVVHYLEVFSRPSETFIRDLISRLRVQSPDAHMIICDKRVLATERPFAAVFTFDYNAHPTFFSNLVTEFLLATIVPYYFVFHFATNGWRFLTRVHPSFQSVP